MSDRLRLQAAALLFALACACGHAGAASLQVAPTSLTLQATQNADGLWLSNSGTAPVQVQVRVYRWTQLDGKEALEPTQDLVISPPMQTLPPGQRQLVRVIRTAPVPPPTELSYRVIVDELPTDASASSVQGLRFVLRYSIPVFVAPPSPAPGSSDAKAAAFAPVLQLHVVTGDDGQALLEVRNSGNQHAQIADLAFGPDAASAKVIAPGLLGYALADQTMRWPLHATTSHFVDGTFTARINSEPELRTLPVAPAPR